MKTLKIKFCFLVAGAFLRLILLRSRLRGYRHGQIDLWSHAQAWEARARSIIAGPPKSPVELTLHLQLKKGMEVPAKSDWEMGQLERLNIIKNRPVLGLRYVGPCVDRHHAMALEKTQEV